MILTLLARLASPGFEYFSSDPSLKGYHSRITHNIFININVCVCRQVLAYVHEFLHRLLQKTSLKIQHDELHHIAFCVYKNLKE